MAETLRKCKIFVISVKYVNQTKIRHRQREQASWGGGGSSHMKGAGMLIVSLRGVNV